MRVSSYVAISALGISIGLYEGSLVGSLPDYFLFFRPLIPIIVLFFLLKRPQAAYITAGAAGVVVDMLSAIPTGFATARWLMVAFLVDLVLENVITNKSLYGAWVLIFIARIADVLILALSFILYRYVLERSFYYSSVYDYLYTFGVDLIFVTFMFLSTSVFTKRFLTYIPFVKGRYGA